MSDKEKKASKPDVEETGKGGMTALPICRSLGICFGCAIGAALDNISVGVAMGLGIGSLVGGAISLISTMKTKNINKVDREKKENQEETK